jgi:hypothetical protein
VPETAEIISNRTKIADGKLLDIIGIVFGLLPFDAEICGMYLSLLCNCETSCLSLLCCEVPRSWYLSLFGMMEFSGRYFSLVWQVEVEPGSSTEYSSTSWRLGLSEFVQIGGQGQKNFNLRRSEL